MLKRFHILTVSHKHTQLSTLADLAIQAPDEDALRTKLLRLKSEFGLDELMYMATCNRVMYAFSTANPVNAGFIRAFTDLIHPRLSEAQLTEYTGIFQLLSGMDAVNHLFEVAASIDSLVVGERQILRQLREAYERSSAWGLTGDTIKLALQHAIVAAKSVYSKTGIGEKSVSVVALAIRQLLQKPLNEDTRILFIGAGQTNELAAKILAKHQPKHVAVFNRSLDKAQRLADQFNGNAFPLSDLDGYTEGFDIAIVCTGAQQAIITPDLYKRLLAGESGEKTVIDLSVPNNVHPDVVSDFPVRFIEIEGLRKMAQANQAYREEEVKKAREILSAFLDEFPMLLKQRQAEIAFRSVPEEVKAVKHKAINEVFRGELEQLDPSARALIEKMMDYMEKKCVGIPMRVAREAAAIR
ncbi:MAG TPA: glutamyl-tRNA reductase [Flavilitoribacter sp.]|nr:glutamyl-tRNA reductase [Flavilitoribacter sp.]HMQ90706.1 glutamyl-tRNA reductase [Flavilitoribacter sp.]